MFQIVCLRTGEVRAKDIVDGHLAQEMCATFDEETGFKHQPRPMEAVIDWRGREQGRFDKKHYKPLPWANEAWANKYPDHFAHVSNQKPGCIAFIENEEKGVKDVHSRMRPGRYLKTFFPDLPPLESGKWIDHYITQYEQIKIEFARTPEEIEHVYVNGPNSCMKISVDHFNGAKMHPSRLYGGGDLAVAYLTDDRNRITARAICWPEKRVYGRIYGDSVRLDGIFRRLEYKVADHSSWEGARCAKIEYKGQFMGPSMDIMNRLREEGDHFVIDSKGLWGCGSTSGFLQNLGRKCNFCGVTYNAHNMQTLYVPGAPGGQKSICNECSKKEMFYCPITGGHFPNKEKVVVGGVDWSKPAFERYGFTCDATKQNYHRDYAVLMANGERWYSGYYQKNGRQCSHCRGRFPITQHAKCAKNPANQQIAT